MHDCIWNSYNAYNSYLSFNIGTLWLSSIIFSIRECRAQYVFSCSPPMYYLITMICRFECNLCIWNRCSNFDNTTKWIFYTIPSSFSCHLLTQFICTTFYVSLFICTTFFLYFSFSFYVSETLFRVHASFFSSEVIWIDSILGIYTIL